MNVIRSNSHVLELALVVGAILLSASTGPDQAEPSAQATSDEHRVLVTGNTSTLIYGPAVLPWHDEGLCTSFHVSSLGSALHNVRIAASGLGGVTFSTIERADERCVEDGALQLTLDTLTRSGRWITARLPLPVARAEASLEGSFLVMVPGSAPVETAVKLVPENSTFTVAGLWFLGIAVPALLAFALGYLGKNLHETYKRREEEKDCFEQFKLDERARLDDFFEHLYPEMYADENDQKFGEALRKVFNARDYWRSIPKRERRALEKVISRGDREMINTSMSKVFSEWKHHIGRPQA